MSNFKDADYFTAARKAAGIPDTVEYQKPPRYKEWEEEGAWSEESEPTSEAELEKLGEEAFGKRR